jgi:uncharacterized protein YndB with AHSA1/START domain
MPIKKDGTGKRWVEMEFIAPGTPEQVWQAMATGAGNAAWFTKAEIEERVGGVLKFDFGAMGDTTGEVTVWEPPYRFGYVEREWSEGAPPVATEITITSRSGGKCVVRMVHSLFSSSDDWDDQMEGFEGGWPGFFEVLRIYLAHFAGMKAVSFQAMVSIEADQLVGWQSLMKRLDLVGANFGERRTTPSQPERLSGTIEHVLQSSKSRVVTMRLDEPGPGVAMIGAYDAGGRTNLSMCIFSYGDDAAARAAASESKWRAWLAQTFEARAGA